MFLSPRSLAGNSFGAISHTVLHAASTERRLITAAAAKPAWKMFVHPDKREIAAALSAALIFISLKGV